MSIFKRVFLFLAANIAIIAVFSIILSVLNVQPYLTPYGLNLESLLIYSAIIGFTGSLVSLLISKWMAKMAFSIQIITDPRGGAEANLFLTVKRLAEKAGISMPEVGIYVSPEPNAFATGYSKNNALVAVSTGLLESMTQDELEGVLAHEISHAANGDMVTMALLQGVVNTFVIFFARIAAYVVQSFLSRERDDNGHVGGLAYYLTSIVFEILFGILASILVMSFSRWREFRADAGSAQLSGSEKMIAALQKLQVLTAKVPVDDTRGKSFRSMQISDQPNRFFSLFSSHPPLEARIAALQKGVRQ
ncbi:protease HtpX [Candidatus Peregrinibacteria bacterium]|nr:MAG: protease HtpX [Candidatus Peregrinibacteria bacterium]